MNSCEKLSIKDADVVSFKNLVKISNVLNELLGCHYGLIRLDTEDVYEFIKGAKEIKTQSCLIEDISPKYPEPENISKEQIIDLEDKITKELVQIFSKAGMTIKSNASKRLLIVGASPSTTLRMVDCIFLLFGKGIEHKMGMNNSRPFYGNPLLNITVIDIYE